MRAPRLLFLLLLLAFLPVYAQQAPDSTLIDSVRIESASPDSGRYDADTTDAEADEAEDTTAVDPHVVRFDSSAVELRRPAPGKVEGFRSDDDFIYEKHQQAPRTLWDRISEWLASLLMRALGSSATGPALKVIAYLIVGIAAVFVVLKLVGVDVRGMFGGDSEKTNLQAGIIDEDIHTMDFDGMIADAVARGEFRWGIRLHYMRTLKELADLKLIAWKPEKTNQDYLRELRSASLRGAFEATTMLFEYAWYGDLPVNELMFRQAERRFAEFRAELSGGVERAR